jgi:hypothetical protein
MDGIRREDIGQDTRVLRVVRMCGRASDVRETVYGTLHILYTGRSQLGRHFGENQLTVSTNLIIGLKGAVVNWDPLQGSVNSQNS